VIDDARVRAAIYDATMRTGRPPLAADLASALKIDAAEVRESLQRLATARALVLQPSGEILMANPFSAVPTPFRVVAGSLSSFGNCIWDSLGIAAMLRSDAVITTSCGDCGEAMQVHVTGDRVSGEGLLHFAIPARQWWNDIVFT
jgi:alkylmercury lyase-like protein